MIPLAASAAAWARRASSWAAWSSPASAVAASPKAPDPVPTASRVSWTCLRNARLAMPIQCPPQAASAAAPRLTATPSMVAAAADSRPAAARRAWGRPPGS
jgi:hypothetical protein